MGEILIIRSCFLELVNEVGWVQYYLLNNKFYMKNHTINRQQDVVLIQNYNMNNALQNSLVARRWQYGSGCLDGKKSDSNSV